MDITDNDAEPDEENRSLRRTMRDLVALSTLPAIWTGLGPEGIARSLADVLFNTLSLDLLYVWLRGLLDERVIEVLRTKQRTDEAHDDTIKTSLARLVSAEPDEPPSAIPNPFGEGALHLAITRFGIAGDEGVLISGSLNAEFPSERDRLLLGVGANQTTIVLQRLRAEEQVREQAERLRTTLASIGDAVITTDTKGRCTNLNAVAESLTGWTNDEAVDQPLDVVFRIVNEQTRLPVANPATRALEGALVGLANHTILIAKDGSEHPIDDSAAPIRNEDGESVGCVLVFRDVAERRQAEKQLQASEARKRAMFETALDCIIKMDGTGTVVDLNPVAEKTFGYSRAEAVGRRLADLIIPSRLREKHEQGLATFLATGEGPVLGTRLELPALRADGSEFPAEVAITHVPLEGSSLFTGFIRDITERKRVEQYRNARHDATQVLTTATTVSQGIVGVLSALCRNLDWEIGYYWSVDKHKNVLVCRDGYAKTQETTTAFQSASRQIEFRRGEGLPGSVWAERGPKWILDVSRQAIFSRAASAAKDGLHSAFACPVIIGEQVIGVIECFHKSIKEPDTDLLEMTETLAGHLGQFIERKLAESELEQKVEELEDFFQNATIGLHWVGPDGTILKVNHAELDLLGYSEGEYVGHSIRDFHADEDVISDILERLQGGKDLRDYPARLRCKDGSIKEVLIDSSVLWKAGQFVHTRCLTRDVTDRNRAERRLKEQEQQTRNILESITDAFFAVDRDRRFTYLNRQAEQLLGRPAGALLGCVLWDEFPSLKGSPFEQAYREAESSQTSLSVTSYYSDHDRWYEAHVYPAVKGISVYFRDVSERKRNEAILVGQKRALELLIDNAPLTDVLDALCKVIEGQSQQKLVATILLVDEDGQSLRSIAGRRAPVAYTQAIDGVVIGPCVGSCGSAAYRGEQVIVSDIDTDPLWADYRELALSHGLRACWSTPILTSANQVLGTFAVYALSPSQPTSDQLSLIDVLARTAGIAIDRRRGEEALRLADQRKDEFLATLAHELRNPLAPIRTGLEVMKMTKDDPDALDEVRSTMERQTQQLIMLVDDLLDVSRITSGKFELRKCRVNLADIVQSAVEACRPYIAEAQHELIIELPVQPIYLNADPHRLAQVLSNLLNNSTKYTPDTGRIRLSAEQQGRDVVISVEDNGLGIPVDMLDLIFETFAQINRPQERGYTGLGIGLSLVKSLVEMHDGRVEVHSEGEGKGSLFSVRLPILVEMPVEEQAPTSPGIQPRSSSKRKVLVVDDNKAAATMLSMVVKMLGNEVRKAYDGREAIELAAEYLPDGV